jgi:hypothetical protein
MLGCVIIGLIVCFRQFQNDRRGALLARRQARKPVPHRMQDPTWRHCLAWQVGLGRLAIDCQQSATPT